MSGEADPDDERPELDAEHSNGLICPDCQGSGLDDEGDTCPACEGAGQIGQILGGG